MEIWLHSTFDQIFRVKITLNNDKILEYDGTPTGTALSSPFVYSVPAGQEFSGILIGTGHPSGCLLSWLFGVIRTPVCTIDLDLSPINNGIQSITVDQAQTKIFSGAPSIECGSVQAEYQVTYIPTSSTTNLITLPTATLPSILFAKSTNNADAMSYTVTVKGRVVGTATWTNTATAIYTYSNLCASTSITAPQLSQMQTSVLVQTSPGGGPLYVTQISTATNSASVTQSNPNFCGNYQYSISSVPNSGNSALTFTELTIDAITGLIQLYTANELTVGTHTATVITGLVSFPALPQESATFQIVIDKCIVTTFNMANLIPQTYTLDTSPFMLTVAASSVITQAPACGYTEILTSIQNPSFITTLPVTPSDYIDFLVYSRDPSFAGIYQLRVVATLNDYPYISPTSTCEQTFTVTVLDPCESTSIISYQTEIESLVAFVGYTTKSKIKYTYNDTVSVARTFSTDSKDFCGEKQLSFILNGTTTTNLYASNEDFIYLNPSAQTTNFGTGFARVQASMKNYPSIKSQIKSFSVTVLGYVVPMISDRIYILKSEPLLIKYEPFQLLPKNYDFGLYSIKAFVFYGHVLPTKLDLLCDCMKNTKDIDWITLDSIANTLKVQTSKSIHIGEKIIVLVLQLDQYIDITPYSSLTISIRTNNQANHAYQQKQIQYSVIQQKSQPSAKILRIESNGRIYIKFTNLMTVPFEPQFIQNDTTLLNGVYAPIISIQLIPGKYTNANLTRFNWTFVQYTPQQLVLQLQFENPQYISSKNAHPDFLQIVLNGVEYFQDNLGNKMLQPTKLSQHLIPPQASDLAVQIALEQLSITKSTLVSMSFMLLLSGPIQQILNSFRHTQIMVHLVLIAVNQPAPALIFFGGLLNLLNFQLIDFTEFYNSLFHLDPDSNGNNPFNSQFELMGYGSLYIVQNFGLLCMTVFSPIVARVLASLMILIAKERKCLNRVDLYSIKDKTQKWLKYSFWISYLDETYLFLAICSSLNLRSYFKWNQAGDATNSLLALCVGLLIIIFPVFVSIFYSLERNYSRIRTGDTDFKDRFGSIIDGLNFKRRGRFALYYPVVSLFRKMWLAYILVFKNDKPVVNIFCVVVQALMMITVTGIAEPMIIVRENRMSIFNEFSVLIFAYHLIPLTDFMTDLNARNLVGQSLIAVTLFNLGVNILLALAQNLNIWRNKFVLWSRRRKYRRDKLKAKQQKVRMFSEMLMEHRQTTFSDFQASRLEFNLKEQQKEHILILEDVEVQSESSKLCLDTHKTQLEQFNDPTKEKQTQSIKQIQLYNRQNRQNLNQQQSLDLKKEELSADQPSECSRIVREHKLGKKLQPLGQHTQAAKVQKKRFKQDFKDELIFDGELQFRENNQSRNKMVSQSISQTRLSQNFVSQAIEESADLRQIKILTHGTIENLQIEQRHKRVAKAVEKSRNLNHKKAVVQPQKTKQNRQTSDRKVDQQQSIGVESIQVVECPKSILKSRQILLQKLVKYSKPNHSEIQMSQEQISECKQKVKDHNLGADLRTIGRIQGPIAIYQHTNIISEVVFVFNRQLLCNDMWDSRKQRQMAQAFIESRAVSEIQVPDDHSRNYVGLKTKKQRGQVQRLGVQKIQGLKLTPAQILASTDGRPASLNRKENLKNLCKQFTGLVEQTILFDMKSQFYHKKVEVYCVKLDTELVRFGILVDGVDSYKVTDLYGLMSWVVELKLIDLLKTAHKLCYDFPQKVRDDIVSGVFEKRLQRYQTLRSGNERNNFKDFGVVTDEMEFEDLVLLYEEICNQDDRIRIQQTREAGFLL